MLQTHGIGESGRGLRQRSAVIPSDLSWEDAGRGMSILGPPCSPRGAEDGAPGAGTGAVQPRAGRVLCIQLLPRASFCLLPLFALASGRAMLPQLHGCGSSPSWR